MCKSRTMKPPVDFLKRGYPPFNASMWCVREQDTTMHTLEFVANKNNRVSYYKTCLGCKERYEKLMGLGVDIEDPRKADVMPVTEYVFLVYRRENVLM